MHLCQSALHLTTKGKIIVTKWRLTVHRILQLLQQKYKKDQRTEMKQLSHSQEYDIFLRSTGSLTQTHQLQPIDGILNDDILSHFTSDCFSGKCPAHAVVLCLSGKEKWLWHQIMSWEAQDQFPAPSWSGQPLSMYLTPLPVTPPDLLAHILIIGRYLGASGNMSSFCLRAITKGFYQAVICRHCKNLWLTENAKRKYTDFKYMNSNET